MSETVRNDDGGIAVTVGLGFIQTCMFVYDFFTYPLYYAIQQPWKRVEAMEAIRATRIEETKTSVTYKPIEKSCEDLDKFKAAGIQTMYDCFEYAVKLHSHSRMLGTRTVIREEDEVQPNGKNFKKWEMGDYEWKSYTQIDEMANNFGKGLRVTGLNPMDRICIFAETKADWLVCALGCFKQTFPLVTLYANLGDDAVAHGVNETEVTHVITTHELLPKFKNVLAQTPTVKHIIFLEDQINPTDKSGYRQDVNIHAFQEIIEMGRTTTVNYPVRRPTQDDPAIIMYTSGSTGTPKGVVLPHEALVTTVKGFFFVVNPTRPGDIYLGYLPLAHILELLAEMTMLVQGISVGYSSPNTMIDTSTKLKKGTKGDCTVLRPTLMCAVPLVIDRIYKGIQQKVSKKGPFFRRLIDFCYRYKSAYRRRGMPTPILDFLIFNKMSAIVGGKIRLLLSGGAPLSPDTHDFVRCALDLPLVQGYGLTETCACATIMDADEISTGAAGPPLQGVQIQLINWDEGNYTVNDQPNPRGEIVIGGGNVASEYFRQPEKTEEDFSCDASGRRWFKTGDIGQMNPDGTLKIVDRKKDLVKLHHGEYVSLGKVESLLKTHPLIDNICVYGDSLESFVICLVMPDHNKLTEMAEKLNIATESFEEMCKDTTLNAEVVKELQSYGKKVKLERFEIPGAVTLCPELWTPESGLVTAAFKLKRKPIQDYYQKELKQMYEKR